MCLGDAGRTSWGRSLGAEVPRVAVSFVWCHVGWRGQLVERLGGLSAVGQGTFQKMPTGEAEAYEEGQCEKHPSGHSCDRSCYTPIPQARLWNGCLLLKMEENKGKRSLDP